jgi:hypothetical protein
MKNGRTVIKEKAIQLTAEAGTQADRTPVAIHAGETTNKRATIKQYPESRCLND